MKLIIAGTRTIDPDIAYAECLKFRIRRLFPQTEVVSGCCPGVDLAGEAYAAFYDIPVKRFPPDWVRYGRAAGPIRNRAMAEYADALLLIWDGKSPGSANMRAEMQRLGKPVYEVLLNEAK